MSQLLEMVKLISPGGLAMLITLAVLNWKTARAGAFWMVLFRLPSTIIHELSHFLVALLTLARPSGVSLWPRPAGNGYWTLGSVTCGRINFFSAVPVGFAPLVNLLPAWFSLVFAVETGSLLAYALVHFFLAASIPSRADIKVVFSNPASVLLWGVAGFFVASIFQHT